jgi:hypothetical protein
MVADVAAVDDLIPVFAEAVRRATASTGEYIKVADPRLKGISSRAAEANMALMDILPYHLLGTPGFTPPCSMLDKSKPELWKYSARLPPIEYTPKAVSAEPSRAGIESRERYRRMFGNTNALDGIDSR